MTLLRTAARVARAADMRSRKAVVAPPEAVATRAGGVDPLTADPPHGGAERPPRRQTLFRRGGRELPRTADGSHTRVTVASWNLLHGAGATVGDVEQLIRLWQPDLVLLQEATQAIDALPERIGGHYARTPLPGRRHGLACWSASPFESDPEALPLPSGAFVDRISQVVRMPGWAVANVHLSHGQMLNRRQLRRIAADLPPRAAVLGDFNLVGPVLLPGFRDVGPRDPTHRMVDVVPLRIDRCLVRGISCTEAARLPRSRSDHHPIIVRLAW